ncbi:MAG: hypothetical protein WC350_03800 [Candidatus Micrarchaeia archaeon]|jgi:hypothetical protein
MKYAVILLGIALLLFGCIFQGQPEPVAPPPEPEETLCVDGTLPGECSVTQPFYCTSDGQITSDPATCGCPFGTAFLDGTCVINCSDGTPFATCSEVKPFYCTQEAQLIEDADACGCPEGMIFHAGNCISTCTDGTDPRTCSNTHPYYCNEHLALVPDFDNCGCPTGTRLVDGDCVSAHCIDGTPVGSCTSAPSNYCNENMQIVLNPECGCTTGRIQSFDKKFCVNPRPYPYPEGTMLNITTTLSLKVTDSVHPSYCHTGTYIRVNLTATNSASTPFNLTQSDLTVLQRFQSDGYRWNSVQAPVNDTLCFERGPFPFGEIPPRSTVSGEVWFMLLNWQSTATYDMFYQDKNIRLTP